MSDGQTLFLILCLLYLFDCLVWIGSSSILFVAPWCRRWHAKAGNRLISNDRGGVGFLNPLPPLGSAFSGHWSPLSISPAGVSDLTLRATGNSALPVQSDRILHFEQISRIEQDEKWILINEARFARCASPEQAKLLVETIRRIRKVSEPDRAKAITDFLASLFSKQAATDRLSFTIQLLPWIRRTCVAFFLFLYVMVPLAASFLPLIWYILPVAAIMWLAVPIVAVQYYRAHRKLYPERRSDRVMNVIQMVLCPPVAIRACDLLSIDAMSRFHPVLTASLLLGDDAAAFYGPAIRDLRYPLKCGKSADKAADVASWYANAELEATAGFLKTERPAALEACFTPPPWDGVSTSYCPRCLCQFTVGTGDCPDCPGVGVVPISDLQRKGAPHV